MTPEGTSPSNLQRSSAEIVQGLLERTAKAIAGLGAVVYIIGYAITAARLAEYGVSTTELLDAQYFVAGLVPGLLIWITVFVVISASRFEPRNDEDANTVNRKWIWINVLTGIPVIVLLILSLISPDWFERAWSQLYPAPVAVVLFLGEISLWILVVGLKKRGFARLLNLPLFAKSLTSRLIFLIACGIYVLSLFVVSVLTLIYIPLGGPEVHGQIPQAYGGGQSLIVQLYVERQDLPSELFDRDPEGATQSGSPVYTAPVRLIFRTSSEYIVDRIGDCVRRAWVIKASAVFAMVEIDDTTRDRLENLRCND